MAQDRSIYEKLEDQGEVEEAVGLGSQNNTKKSKNGKGERGSNVLYLAKTRASPSAGAGSSSQLSTPSDSGEVDDPNERLIPTGTGTGANDAESVALHIGQGRTKGSGRQLAHAVRSPNSVPSNPDSHREISVDPPPPSYHAVMGSGGGGESLLAMTGQPTGLGGGSLGVSPYEPVGNNPKVEPFTALIFSILATFFCCVMCGAVAMGYALAALVEQRECRERQENPLSYLFNGGNRIEDLTRRSMRWSYLALTTGITLYTLILFFMLMNLATVVSVRDLQEAERLAKENGEYNRMRYEVMGGWFHTGGRGWTHQTTTLASLQVNLTESN